MAKTLSPSQFIVTTIYCSFMGNVYQHKFGTALGSPVSPVMDNLLVEWLELLFSQHQDICHSGRHKVDTLFIAEYDNEQHEPRLLFVYIYIGILFFVVLSPGLWPRHGL